MTLLMRASELLGRPVVTMAGEDIAQVKDVVYSSGSGEVSGFTLAGRGLFSGPLKTALPVGAVAAIGPDAVMIADDTVLTGLDTVAQAADVRERDVLGNRVITDAGTELGTVTDVILQTGPVTDVVGYQVHTSAAFAAHGPTVFIPLPDTLAVSGEALIVPAGAAEFVSHDLAGFGAAVTAFRSHLKGVADVVQ
jgi:uncharacterized protein YrrD